MIESVRNEKDEKGFKGTINYNAFKNCVIIMYTVKIV